MGKGTKIIVVDDNLNLCNLLKTYIEDQDDLSIVGEAHDGF